MSKKMKVLIAVLVAILTLTVSGVAAVLAQDDDGTEPDEQGLIEELDEMAPGFRLFKASMESDEFLSKLADILDISEEELREAFEKARQEVIAERTEEAFYEFLERAVAEGLIDDEEASEIEEWWQDKPAALDWTLLQKAFFMMRPQARDFTNKTGGQFQEMRQSKWQWRQTIGTTDEADEIRGRTGSRSAALSQPSSNLQLRKAVRGRNMTASALSAG